MRLLKVIQKRVEPPLAAKISLEDVWMKFLSRVATADGHLIRPT